MNINMAWANRDQQTPIDNKSFFLLDNEKIGSVCFPWRMGSTNFEAQYFYSTRRCNDWHQD